MEDNHNINIPDYYTSDQYMSTNYAFLPYFITETIYVVPEPNLPYDGILTTPDIVMEANDLLLKQDDEKIIFSSRGNFNKKILIIIDDPEDEIINQTDDEFLGKILKAVHLSDDDISIVNVHKLQEHTLKDLTREFDYNIMLALGVESFFLNDNYSLYQINREGDKRVLYADALSVINRDKEKKLKLWENLQLLFIK